MAKRAIIGRMALAVMTWSSRQRILPAVMAMALVACDSDSSDGAHGGSPPNGGSTGSSGASGSGGTSGSGDASGNGGRGSGGESGSAGMSGSGGESGSAGMSGSGAGGTGGTGGAGGVGAGGSQDAGGSAYDRLVLADGPVAYWAIDQAPAAEPDLTGNGHTGRYPKGASALVSLPNGDRSHDFNGVDQSLSVPSSAAFSIPTTHELTWEAWIRPDVLQFPNDDGTSGYVAWMGKCEEYAPSCEWEARLYNTNTNESPNRPNRFSAYVFNPGAGLGSGADWQPEPGLIRAGDWYHVVGEYTTLDQPANCRNTAQFPGSIEIWVNGVRWDHASHGQTGCMSQYSVVPVANGSAVDIGSMAGDSWFSGAIGKVAIYDRLLTASQIESHYRVMTGKAKTGSCGDTCSF